jgi:NAD dependent epimerase/dehydratase family enzyme
MFVLQLLTGDMAKEILASIRAHPKLLLDNGFEFRNADIQETLRDLLS